MNALVTPDVVGILSATLLDWEQRCELAPQLPHVDAGTADLCVEVALKRGFPFKRSMRALLPV